MSEGGQSVGRDEVRSRIVATASQLLRDEGAAAVTTRRVADLAGVQAPTIYRLFGDKDGLVEAVAEQVMAAHVAAKADVVRAASAAAIDPVKELRAGWDNQIDFGLTNPAIFRLLSDPLRVADSPAARTGREVLRTRVHRIAVGGRLRVEEEHAVDVIQAAGIGAVHVLLAQPPQDRDPELADSMFAAVLGQILASAPAASDEEPTADPRSTDDATVAAAVTLRAVLPDLPGFSAGERRLLGEWLDRAVDDAGSGVHRVAK